MSVSASASSPNARLTEVLVSLPVTDPLESGTVDLITPTGAVVLTADLLEKHRIYDDEVPEGYWHIFFQNPPARGLRALVTVLYGSTTYSTTVQVRVFDAESPLTNA